MNILFLINEMERGGAERVVSYLLNHLPKIFPELIPVLFVLEESEYAYPIPDNLEIVTGSKYHSSNFVKLIKIPLLAFRLKQYIKKNNINSVISFLSRANYTNIVAKYYGSDHRCIISERNTTSLMYKSRSISDMVNRFFVRKLYPSSDEIIAVSKGVQRDLLDNFSIPESKISVIYNPYDIDMITQKSQEEVKHQWLDLREYATIITVGHLEESKNHSLLIRAFGKVSKKLSNARLIIIGDGSERNKLSHLITSHGLSNKVELTGELKNPFSYLSRADLFVLSSNMEGFPNVLVEAMICGCPVISTNCRSGPDEIITNGVNGILVPVGNIKALSNAIITILQNEQLRMDLRNKAEESIQEYEITKIVKEYKRILIQNAKYS